MPLNETSEHQVLTVRNGQLFTTDRSKAVLLLWFKFIKVIPIMCFMLHDFVATRISFGCSLSPLHFTCSVQASTVTTCSPCFPLYMFYVGTYVYFLNMIFLISCLYLCITEPLQKLRARFGAYKTGLSPPVTLCY